MTNDDLRERVARAIFLSRYEKEGGKWEAVAPEHKENPWRCMADAAIGEMGVVKVKPLTWYEKPDGQDILIGRCDQISYSVGFKMGRWGYQRCGSKVHVVSYKGGPIFTCEVDAIDGADIDHEDRILALMEDTGDE